MKHIIDNKTGMLMFIPESDKDRQILYYLINCPDLSIFSEYLTQEQSVTNKPVTTDLGVDAEEIEQYAVSSEIESTLKLGDRVREIQIESGRQSSSSPDRPGSLYTGNLIGFLR